MALITARELSIRYRGPALLDHVTCQIEAGHRIGLLGRNGAGKTTFLRMLSGEVEPDSGDITVAPGTKISLLSQTVPRDLEGPVYEVVARALPPAAVEDQWKRQQAVEQILSRMELDGEAPFEFLSSGMKRRVLLARTLVTAPDVLLLDEPTNHLDIDAITWLEKFLARWDGTLIFVTHDRMFLRKLADRIMEIDRGQLFDWSCDYDTFIKRKEALLEAEEKQDALFDKKLAKEEAWIREGIKARRTRNEGRVRALKEMRQIRAERRRAPRNMQLEIDSGQRSGKLVAQLENVSFAHDQRPIVRNFSTQVMRGDKIGVIGPNGVGKTTLLRLLLGQLPPQAGAVRLGTNLQIAYFDQLRDQLDEERTVQENVADGYESVGSGAKAQHVLGYLQNFLFSPERARTPVRFLSGGERNRVLLARLFAKPANVIVLDEPTNDLDTESLELLESRLVQFEGTVLVVSHDREFLNNVVTSTVVFEPSGVREYVGGYDDWLQQRSEQPTETAEGTERKARKDSAAQPAANGRQKQSAGGPATSQENGRRRLKYKEKQELAAMPDAIERLEADVSKLYESMAETDFYQQSSEEIAQENARLKELEDQLAAAYHRWEELDELAE